MSGFVARLVRHRISSSRPSWDASTVARPVLLGLVVATALTIDVSAASASDCPTSIDAAVRISELGSAEEFAPSELDRSFPDVPERLAPGSGGRDHLRIRSIADVPVDASLRVADETSPVGGDGDLHVSITWNGDTVAEGSYGDVVGQSYEFGRLAPDSEGTLGVEVELPSAGELDNRTQNRTWPLRFSLGIGSDCDGASDDGADASQSADADDSTHADTSSHADSSTRADSSSRADTSNRADESTRADTSSHADSSGRAEAVGSSDDRGDSGSSGVRDPDSASTGAGGADDGTAEGGSNLPRTGFDSAGIIILAGAALGFGAVLLAATRRRRSGGEQ